MLLSKQAKNTESMETQTNHKELKQVKAKSSNDLHQFNIIEWTLSLLMVLSEIYCIDYLKLREGSSINNNSLDHLIFDNINDLPNHKGNPQSNQTSNGSNSIPNMKRSLKP